MLGEHPGSLFGAHHVCISSLSDLQQGPDISVLSPQATVARARPVPGVDRGSQGKAARYDRPRANERPTPRQPGSGEPQPAAVGGAKTGSPGSWVCG